MDLLSHPESFVDIASRGVNIELTDEMAGSELSEDELLEVFAIARLDLA